MVIGNITSNTMTTYSNDWETLLTLIFNFKKFNKMAVQPISAIFSNLKYKEKLCHRVIKIPFDSKSQKVSYCCTSLFLQEQFRQLPILTTDESVDNQALFLFTSTSLSCLFLLCCLNGTMNCAWRELKWFHIFKNLLLNKCTCIKPSCITES